MTCSLDPFIGPAAGVATSVLWSITAICFTAAGKRLGATVVNATRIAVAVVLLGVTHRLVSDGQTWVPGASGYQVLLLALSGLVGLSIGDLALFAAFVRVGPRISMLVMTTSPIFATLLGWLALDETLSLVAWLGVALTVIGVGWVVLERPSRADAVNHPERLSGIVLAFFAAACQAGGLLLSKQGMGHGWLPREAHMDPQAATLIRMFFAGVFVIPSIAWLAARTRSRHPLRRASVSPAARRTGYLLAACGGFGGAFLGVWLSLVASDRTPLGIAQTTCSLSPVFILPWVMLFYKERVSIRAAAGALVAVAGTALLFVPASAG